MRQLRKVANKKHWKIPNYEEIRVAVENDEFTEWKNEDNAVVLYLDKFTENSEAKCVDVRTLEQYKTHETFIFNCAVIPIQKKCKNCDNYRKHETGEYCRFLEIDLYKTPAMSEQTFYCSEWEKK